MLIVYEVISHLDDIVVEIDMPINQSVSTLPQNSLKSLIFYHAFQVNLILFFQADDFKEKLVCGRLLLGQELENQKQLHVFGVDTEALEIVTHR